MWVSRRCATAVEVIEADGAASARQRVDVWGARHAAGEADIPEPQIVCHYEDHRGPRRAL